MGKPRLFLRLNLEIYGLALPSRVIYPPEGFQFIPLTADVDPSDPDSNSVKALHHGPVFTSMPSAFLLLASLL